MLELLHGNPISTLQGCLLPILIVVFSATTPLGCLLATLMLNGASGTSLNDGSLVSAILSGLGAGSLLYVTVFELLHHGSKDRGRGIVRGVWITLGAATVTLIQTFTSEEG